MHLSSGGCQRQLRRYPQLPFDNEPEYYDDYEYYDDDLSPSAAPAAVAAAVRVSASSTTLTASPAPSRSPVVAPASTPSTPVYTVTDCRRMGAWGDVCTYENLCHDGTAFFFLVPRGGCNGSVGTSCPTFYEDADLKEGLIFPKHPVKSTRRLTFPFNGGERGIFLPSTDQCLLYRRLASHVAVMLSHRRADWAPGKPSRPHQRRCERHVD